jgi:hypothetical protein
MHVASKAAPHSCAACAICARSGCTLALKGRASRSQPGAGAREAGCLASARRSQRTSVGEAKQLRALGHVVGHIIEVDKDALAARTAATEQHERRGLGHLRIA